MTEEFIEKSGSSPSAERRLAIQEGRPYATPIEFPHRWCGGAPQPVLLSSEHKTFLIFHMEGGDDCVGRVEFHDVWSAKLGEPDENGILGHPLVGSGLEFDCPCEISSSQWIAEIADTFSFSHSNVEPMEHEMRHLIFPFHDSTFECVARSYTVCEFDLPYKTVINLAAQLL